MAGSSAASSVPPDPPLQMIDGFMLRRTALIAALCAAAMAVLLPCLALVRDTTAHDWYAAGKLTLTEVTIAIGFEPYAATEYRTPDGGTMRITRAGLAFYGEPIRARERIVSTAGDHAVLGAGAGAACAVLCVMLLSGAGRVRRQRTRMPRTPDAARSRVR